MTYIEDRYGDGECGLFAQALNSLRGYPIVLFCCADDADISLPKGFPRHAAVEISPGNYLDAFGWSSLAGIERRFSCRLMVIKDPDTMAYPFESNFSAGSNDDVDDALKFATQFVKNYEKNSMSLKL